MLAVQQQDTADARFYSLWSDTTIFLEGIARSGFFAGLSAEVRVLEIDSNSVSLQLHAVTFGPPNNNYAKQLRVQFEAPAYSGRIIGKNGASYRLALIPLQPMEIDTSGCAYRHTGSNEFFGEPSAHTDVYYIQGSLAHFHWSLIRGLFEDAYDRLDQLAKLTLPGKYYLYAIPCEAHSVIWDRRFGTMVDPTRNTASFLYNRDIRAADPISLLLLAIYKHYGYAPAFLAEGFAGYLSPSIVDVRKLLTDRKEPILEPLLSPGSYFAAEPYLADRVAASFVKYLLDTYGIDKLLTAYRHSDDLTLQHTLESVYEKQITELEREWRAFVDTLKISAITLSRYADEAEALNAFERAVAFSELALQQSKTTRDSLMLLASLASRHFSLGNYRDAVTHQEALLKIDTSRQSTRLVAAAYALMAGENESAHRHLMEARTLGDEDDMLSFNLALYHLANGDKDSARTYFEKTLSLSGKRGAMLETKAMLSELLLASDRAQDREYGRRLLVDLTTGPAINRSMPPTIYLWRGIGLLGQKKLDSAHTYLNAALFLEANPFYQGLIHLWLGKLYDARGKRTDAKTEYEMVLSTPSAAYTKNEARRLLESPYILR